MKVLVSAYACEPGAGSEPGAGWAWARAAALDHDVWLLTRANNAPAIEEALTAEPDLRLHPVYLDLPRWARFWKRGGWGVHLYYLLWQVLARRAGKRLHAQLGFDVAHHITFAVDWMPAGVVGISGLPSVWGPVGGATGTPWSLWRWLGWQGILSEALREATTRPMRRVFGDQVARRASLIVAQNLDVARRFAEFGALVVQPNVAIDLGKLTCTIERVVSQRGNAPRAVFVGRLLPWKGLRLAIAALAEPNAAAWELHVYGIGPERKHAEELAFRFGIGERVAFHGKCDRFEVLEAMATSDALLLPTMHDSASWAVGEARALGVPIVCLDRGGPPVIAEDAGNAVRPRGSATPASLAKALASIPSFKKPSGRWSAARLPDLVHDWYQKSALDSATNASEFPTSQGRINVLVGRRGRPSARKGREDTEILRVVHYYPRAMVGDGGPTVAMWGWAMAVAQLGIPSTVLYDAALDGASPLFAPTVEKVPLAHRAAGRLYHPAGITDWLLPGDLLVLHSAYLTHNLLAAHTSARAGIPYVVMPHGAYDPRSRARRRILKQVWELLERPYLERALAVHLFHPPEENGLRMVAPGAYPIVAPTGFTPPHSLTWDGGSGGYLAWFGRYDIEHKGLDLLIDALALLPAGKRPRVRLHGRDSKNTRSDVEKLVCRAGLDGTVDVAGPVTGPAKSEFLARSVGWVHPSRWESHSTALGEALSAGLPCLVTSSNPIASLMSNRKAAVVVDPTPSAIGSGLRLLQEGGRRYSQGAKLLVQEELAWPVVASKFLKQASALLSRGTQ